jgi:hypothetical protein
MANSRSYPWAVKQQINLSLSLYISALRVVNSAPFILSRRPALQSAARCAFNYHMAFRTPDAIAGLLDKLTKQIMQTFDGQFMA